MRSQNAKREALPLSGGEGSQPLPHARRSTRFRGPKR
jgi:hypothetical protein